MEPSVANTVLEREAAAFAELLDRADPSTPVPACPGWSLADLARHLGGIHRWSREAVLVGPSEEVPGPEDPAQLPGWFREGAAALVQTLGSVDPDQPCYTFAPPHTVRFWIRRQAHETALHRWDAAQSLGVPFRMDEAIALDGIDEVVGMFLPRQLRLERLEPGPEVVELSWRPGDAVRVAAEVQQSQRDPAATVTGPADALLLLLWRRIPLTDGRLTVSGSRRDAERLLSKPLTP